MTKKYTLGGKKKNDKTWRTTSRPLGSFSGINETNSTCNHKIRAEMKHQQTEQSLLSHQRQLSDKKSALSVVQVCPRATICNCFLKNKFMHVFESNRYLGYLKQPVALKTIKLMHVFDSNRYFSKKKKKKKMHVLSTANDTFRTGSSRLLFKSN